MAQNACKVYGYMAKRTVFGCIGMPTGNAKNTHCIAKVKKKVSGHYGTPTDGGKCRSYFVLTFKMEEEVVGTPTDKYERRVSGSKMNQRECGKHGLPMDRSHPKDLGGTPRSTVFGLFGLDQVFVKYSTGQMEFAVLFGQRRWFKKVHRTKK